MYLIIGSGRLARHLNRYFELLGDDHIQWKRWSRKENSLEELQTLLMSVNSSTTMRVLLAISDAAIEPFYNQHLKEKNIKALHFSGLKSFSNFPAAHPLMSFGNSFFDLTTYERIHFSISGVQHLQEILPELKNPFTILPADRKPYYHSLCVLGGNFTQILIKKMILSLQAMNIPPEASALYLEQILINTLQDLKSNPTPLSSIAHMDAYLPSSGPLVRKDLETLQLHQKALEKDPFLPVYKIIQELFIKTKPLLKEKESSAHENNL